ncbi:Cell wall assembly regulator SMI1 [Paenibacillus uliginis N3/975]|uniref:Cell wall assembly regulator SMI1 n=1 Tax=Paenibacillus uliginis N3/975 TaxID=1313296 RepID=A0A1X7H631_9BACL|nr:SMI1/KNR4 family protein [Paenibacillus uliginis]SMF79536.1 Cell wall assembly regulator SMI1 [Paenibacillus uliginis N3/975]
MLNDAELLWKRIIEKGIGINENFAEALNLQPGAKDEEFQLLENTLGVILPEQMKAFYKIHNGQEWNLGVESFVRNLTLSPISQIIDNWQFLQDEFDPEDMEADIESGIKPFLWNAKWIPIAENGGGDYLCLDTDPSEAGVTGQVLYYWHDWGKRSVEANNLFEFIGVCMNEDLLE